MKINLSLIALMIVLSGCSFLGDPGSEVILNIDNEFDIQMKEMLSTDGRKLAIEISSVEQLECHDSSLELVQNLSGRVINININDITMPANCESEISYPSGTALFTLATNRYDFGIQIQEQPGYAGDLNVNEDSYYLKLNDAKGFAVINPELRKIPDNFVWGYYQARNEDEQVVLEEFLQTNEYIVRPFTYLSEGFYSYFEIDSEGIVFIRNLPTVGIVKTLAFDLVNLNDIKEVVSNFKTANPDLSLILYASDGSVL